MTNGEERLRLRLVAAGRVQGVGFRRFVELRARGRDVAGWVRNRADGSVEVVVEGAPDVVRALQTDIHRGPPGAHVAELRAESLPADDALPHPFEVRRG
jgi:acylphosphatase